MVIPKNTNFPLVISSNRISPRPIFFKIPSLVLLAARGTLSSLRYDESSTSIRRHRSASGQPLSKFRLQFYEERPEASQWDTDASAPPDDAHFIHSTTSKHCCSSFILHAGGLCIDYWARVHKMVHFRDQVLVYVDFVLLGSLRVDHHFYFAFNKLVSLNV